MAISETKNLSEQFDELISLSVSWPVGEFTFAVGKLANQQVVHKPQLLDWCNVNHLLLTNLCHK